MMAATCEDDYDPEALTVERAMNAIDTAVRPVSGTERLMLRDGLGRVLAQNIRAPFDVPPFVNSAMDGYALRHADLSDAGEDAFTVAGDAFAGRPYRDALGPGECVRIMTGAVLPAGADTVVMQEHVERSDDQIKLRPGHHRGQNVRQAGDDLRRGDPVLRTGRRLNAADLGLLASLGLAEIDARRRPVVAFFSTGDELRGVGQPLEAGQIYDSNRYTLYGLLEHAGVEIRDMGVIPDDTGAVREALRTAAGYSDLVITSGGVSVGAADHIKRILAENGALHFGKVAVKPGRPLTFGTIGQALFFGLPGNPVSVMVTFILFVRRAIQILSGESPAPPPRLRALCQSPLRKTPGRAEYQRGILTWSEAGEPAVTTTGLQGSHVLNSMSRANCLIVLPLDSGGAEPGSAVDVIPFAGFI